VDIAGEEGQLARLRAAVLADAALADALLEIWRPEVFAARAAVAATAVGVRLDASQVGALLARPPTDVVAGDAAPPRGWLPARVSGQAGEPVVDWAFFGARRLTQPFYEDSLGAVTSLAFNRLFRLRTRLADLAPPPAAFAPAGLIFHMSRCGSTLAAQMLAASDANLVVSEAPPIDAVVRIDRATAGLDEAEHAARLAAMVGAFQHAGGGAARLFVKLDSWHACALPLFRRAFPTTPWVFLYREPIEVMVSHLRRRGMQMTPELIAPSFFGADWQGAAPDEDYAARVLAAICTAALAAYEGGGGLLVNYRELPGALASRILPHFGVEAAPEEIAAIEAAAGRDAKDPAAAFAPDSAAKRAAATPAIRAAAQRHLAHVYAQLEATRRGT
jgi:hypothetical protein